jgi:hypothetical protein
MKRNGAFKIQQIFDPTLHYANSYCNGGRNALSQDFIITIICEPTRLD